MKEEAADLLNRIIDEEEAVKLEQEYLNLRKNIVPVIEDLSDDREEKGGFGTPVSPGVIEKDLDLEIDENE